MYLEIYYLCFCNNTLLLSGNVIVSGLLNLTHNVFIFLNIYNFDKMFRL